jgi:hypothetical protein
MRKGKNTTTHINIDKLKYVFIIPYRDRVEHKTFFHHYMTNVVLADYDEDEFVLFYSHQYDDRKFNRGAIKNIGFLYFKHNYPNHYEELTFIFNDVDTVPYTSNLLHFDTSNNEIKHFYGYKFALGGIFSIKGVDFERLNGFPNYWAWGFEDTVIYKRAVQCRINIDRSEFYDILSHKILHFADDFKKMLSLNTYNNILKQRDNFDDGLSTLRNVTYDFFDGMLNVKSFDCMHNENDNSLISHSIFDGTKIKSHKNRRSSNISMGLFSNKRKSLI